MSAFINTYEVVLAFGGREEGGWWYEVRTPLSSKRIRGACFSARSVRYLNRERLKLCMQPSWSKAYQSRCRQSNCVKTGNCRASHNHPIEYANRFYTALGDCRSTVGTEILICVENHPAKYSPETRPQYE
jgi:hypothetical protein